MSESDTKRLENRRWMESKLRSVRFVEWDRYVVGEWGEEQYVSVYGWIDRQDAYKDFLHVIFWPESEHLFWTTSSAKRTEEIYLELVGEDLENHNECIRVEDSFNVENAVNSRSVGTVIDQSGGSR